MSENIGIKAILDDKDFQAGMKRYNSSLGEMNSKTTSTASSISGSFNGIGKAVLGVGATLATGVVVGAVAAAGALAVFTGKGISSAIDLEQQIANIGAILNKTSDEASIFKDIIIDLSVNPDLKVNAQEAGAAIEMLARNGVFAGVAMEDLDRVARATAEATILLSNATGSEMATAADIATDAMAIFNVEAEDMIGVVDGIISVTTNSKFTIEDYSTALRRGGAAAADMGVSQADFNAVIAATSEEMGTGQRAGTGFANFITRLTPSTKAAREEMENLGLIVNGNNVLFDSSTGELKNMSEVSSILNSALGDTRTVMVEVGGRTAEQNAVLSELRSQYGDAEQAIRDYETGVKGITLADDARNKKIEEQRELMLALTPNIEDLAAIQGDMAEHILPALTDQQRSNSIEMIFGASTAGTLLGLMKEGEVVYTDAATAANELGVSLDDVNQFIDGGITGFEAMLLTMSETDALASAATRIDTISGAMEIFKSLVGGVAIKVGDAFLPMIRQLVQAAIALVDQYGDRVAEAFNTFADVISDVVSAAPAIFDFFKKLVGGEGAGGMAAAFMLLPSSIRPAIMAIHDFIKPIIEFVREHADAFIGAFKGLAAVLGAGVIVTVLTAIGAALAAISLPFVAVAGLIIAFGIAWETNFMGMRDVLMEFWEGQAKPALLELQQWLTVNVPLALEALRAFWVDQAWPAIQKAIEVVWPIVQGIIKAYVYYITDIFIPAMITLYNYWVTTLWPAIKKAIEIVWPIIKAIIENMANTMVNVIIPALTDLYNYFVNVLWPGIKSAASSAWAFLKPILVAIGAFFVDTVIPALTELYTYWVDVLWPAITETAQAAWDQIKVSLIAISTFFTDTLIPALLTFKQRWTDLWDGLKLTVSTIWKSIKGVFKKVPKDIDNNLVDPIEMFVETWTERWQELVVRIGAKWLEMQGIFLTVRTAIDEHLIAPIQLFIDFWFEVWNNMVLILQNTWTVISVVFTEIGRWINDNLVPWIVYFQEIWIGVWDAMVLALETIWARVELIFMTIVLWVQETLTNAFIFWRDIVIGVWDAIVLKITETWLIISVIFMVIFTWVQEILVNAFYFYRDIVVSVWDAIFLKITEVWIQIEAIFIIIFTWIQETLSNAFIFWRDTALEVWQAVTTFITEQWDIIMEIFTTIVEWVEVTLKAAFEALQTAVETVWDAIKTKIVLVWGEIEAILVIIEKWFKTKIKDALEELQGHWNRVWGSLTGAVDTVMGKVQPMIDAIKGFASWIAEADFSFDISIPDLPWWAKPGSPLPIHTAWKDFGEWSDKTKIQPSVEMGSVEPLVPAVSNTTNSTTSISERTDNIYNLTMETQESEPSLRQSFKMMEIVG